MLQLKQGETQFILYYDLPQFQTLLKNCKTYIIFLTLYSHFVSLQAWRESMLQQCHLQKPNSRSTIELSLQFIYHPNRWGYSPQQFSYISKIEHSWESLRIVHYSYYIFNTHKEKLKMHKTKIIIYHIKISNFCLIFQKHNLLWPNMVKLKPYHFLV